MKKMLVLRLTPMLCLGLTLPAAAEQKIVVSGQTCEKVLQAMLSCTEDVPVTLRLESDIQLTAAVILGSSDYGGLFGGQVMSVIPHDVTIDLNGHILTREKDVAVSEVQRGYTLTITDLSAADYYYSAVGWACEKGIVNNFGKFYPREPCGRATTFSPDAACTRVQIIAFLYRAFA